MIKNILSFICILVMAAGAFFVMSDWKGMMGEVVNIKPDKHLEKAIPASIGETKSVERPLGNNEEVARATEKILAVNEYINREYTLPDGRKFTIYISYWAPRKESMRVASTHTPDRCWVRNGWKNDDSKKIQNDILQLDGKPLMPAYYREYTIDNLGRNYRRNVWFWFVTDGVRYDYKVADNYAPSPILYIKNMISDALVGSPEMYFVRIDSDSSLKELFKDKDFAAILKSLGELILFEKPKQENQSKQKEQK